MHQTKKGNEWHFGMKVHLGVDSQTGVVHSMTTTSANVHDLTELPRLLHGGESQVWGDAGYQGVDKRPGNRGFSSIKHRADDEPIPCRCRKVQRGLRPAGCDIDRRMGLQYQAPRR